MNYKSLTIIALVLMAMCVAVPVSAMWNNGNWVSEDKNNGCDNVKFDPKTGVTSCYRDNNPENEIKASLEGNGGIAVGSIRAGYSTLSKTVYVRNILQDANGTPMVIDVLPDATFRVPAEGNGILAPGVYDATLDNFDLKDETVRFTIAANQQEPTRISYNGQAASAPEKIVSAAPTETQCQPHTISVTYKIQHEINGDGFWNNWIHIDADYEHLGYNSLFGSDPNVGVLKQLRVVYKYTYETVGYGKHHYHYWKLTVKSAEYGTFCSPVQEQHGWESVQVDEDEDLVISHGSST